MRQTVQTFFPDKDDGLEQSINNFLKLGWLVVSIVPFTASDGLMAYTVVFQEKEATGYKLQGKQEDICE
jgi:hypothetical protein|nr:MAG TPA: protein of unknown function DUF4177 [Caudoviricetes sp.]